MAERKVQQKHERGGSSRAGRQSVAKKLLRDLGKDRMKFAAALLLAAASKLILAIAPMIGGHVTDRIVTFAKSGNYDFTWLGVMCILLAGMYLAGNGADVAVGGLMMDISQTVVKKLRDRGQKKFNRLPLCYMDSHPSGDIQSRLTNDMQSLDTAIQNLIGVLAGQFLLLLFVLIMMFITNPVLTIVYIAVLPLGFLASGMIVRVCTKLVREQNSLMGKISAAAGDSFANYSMIKAYGCEKYKIDTFHEMNRAFYRKYQRAQFLIGFILPISVMVSNLAYILECIVGGLFLMNGKLTIGEFEAFLIYGNMVLTPLTSLSISINSVQSGLVAAERIYDFLEEEEEEDESAKKVLVKTDDRSAVRGAIEFDHVRFGYRPDRELMKDVSFTAKQGETIAIVGPTGAGKTTLVNLLMRYYDIDGGQILLDGTDTYSVDRHSLRSAFGIVLQDSWIFDGTIEENIAYGRKGATHEDVVRAARLAHCDTFIDKLADGYETHISEEKAQLSSGEKQLLSIARTLIADPAILILDEATSQVDTRTELVITEAMENLMKSRTCFVIAHRLFTIRNADKILYMEDGDIKEIGSHNELMARGGRYARLFTQAADYA